MAPRILERIFGQEREPDGVARELERHAEQAPEDGSPAAASRRQRPLAPAEEIIAESLAAKVLDAWLRNRHQTLHPLTVNVRRFERGHVERLAQIMAVSLLAGAQPPDQNRVAAAETWLRAAGADESAVEQLRVSLDRPPALSGLIAGVIEADLASLGYVFALCAADRQDGASRLFIDYLATRLTLSASIVRSANRRYGR